ncbi:hypothetical protein TWF696_008358 [Orbilia brochopaga]|uniref:Uncharacterized protein n=1 Tax=Orbilia brochopaga TaxID=3140254 RepID=A0AAV9UGZ9_9PEZI
MYHQGSYNPIKPLSSNRSLGIFILSSSIVDILYFHRRRLPKPLQLSEHIDSLHQLLHLPSFLRCYNILLEFLRSYRAVYLISLSITSEPLLVGNRLLIAWLDDCHFSRHAWRPSSMALGSMLGYNKIMHPNFAILFVLVGFSTLSTAQLATTATAVTSLPHTLTPQAAAFQPLPPETVLKTFYWFHTNAIGPNTPIPTLRGRILSVEYPGLTKYRVTCLPQDAPAGCTYKDFTVTASGISQMYYETSGPRMSVGCKVHSIASAACSSRSHGEDLAKAKTKTWRAKDFPGYYPVLITAEPTATPWDWNYFYSHATADKVFMPSTAAGGLAFAQRLSRELLAGCVCLSSFLVVTSFL